MGGHRRIDPARQQACHASGCAGGQTARAALLAEEVKRLVRQQFDVNDEVGMFEVDLPAARVLDAPADFPLDLRRGQMKTLVGPARLNTEAATGPPFEIPQDGDGQHIEVQRRPARVREIRDAKRLSDSLTHVFACHTRTEHDFDATHE